MIIFEPVEEALAVLFLATLSHNSPIIGSIIAGRISKYGTTAPKGKSQS